MSITEREQKLLNAMERLEAKYRDPDNDMREAAFDAIQELRIAFEAPAEPVPSNEREKALEEAARIAEEGCLVPPDGGSPTEDERRICENIAARIRALTCLRVVGSAPTP